jgi:hypothetical protein
LLAGFALRKAAAEVRGVVARAEEPPGALDATPGSALARELAGSGRASSIHSSSGTYGAEALPEALPEFLSERNPLRET